MQTITRLPEPSAKHATCAWCRESFDTVVQLIDHVDFGHIALLAAATPEQRSSLEAA